MMSLRLRILFAFLILTGASGAWGVQTYTDTYDHFAVSFPNTPWQVAFPPTQKGDPLEITNFPRTKYGPQGAMPLGAEQRSLPRA